MGILSTGRSEMIWERTYRDVGGGRLSALGMDGCKSRLLLSSQCTVSSPGSGPGRIHIPAVRLEGHGSL
jgi:hypothetical protein